MKKILVFLVALLLSGYLFACAQGWNKAQPPVQNPSVEAPPQTADIDESTNEATDEATGEAAAPDLAKGSLVYKNTQYGFRFTLPDSWRGYSIVTEKWEGLAIGGTKSQEVIETGSLLSIRHPQWKTEKLRQDIPILVFTPDQWKRLQQEEFHIGAAPIGPKELGRNGSYVFALPARYNYAFPEGFEEVEEILASEPLQAE